MKLNKEPDVFAPVIKRVLEMAERRSEYDKEIIESIAYLIARKDTMLMSDEAYITTTSKKTFQYRRIKSNGKLSVSFTAPSISELNVKKHTHIKEILKI